MKKAVVLLSGGLDSATVLAIAKAEGFACYALSFAYGQRHNAELLAAKRIAEVLSVAEHRIVQLDLSAFGGSALTDKSIAVPDYSGSKEIPITYVPARNTIFLSIALAMAEVIGARDIFIGVNSIDYSHYADCRPEFIDAFQQVANLGTKAGVEGDKFHLHAPLQHLDKSEIIRTGLRLGLDYSLTVSCYQATEEGRACGRCDSCIFRKQGFLMAGYPDPTKYL
ncbi:7-cyano-7-deazaguanine synthase QueC [Legionella jordanis]|uniref:7-cyano-7-deazaguanine synthase n=1 Tax=Legionella jordanis TaxID=456 RepID=A0A0W0VD84_9GAMM|nr:7-cyano-7-deazaguanine synthase QueC [Legionella jordanis]KTD17814.1 ExsB protein [Legionella jordanis]RMX02483.1 7-cyano-7-deazaguanine synthase QueC [Legionella jordanis]RMX21674.1 7-cyano-7-deazaguanine synthase QueC [Legionella jordanis]VEH11249.1 ExsB protein [Legionella jordanis]HAT8713783.1 7-cyano-7-deazaguanine synthase QueC [Legionella jordanis]